MARPKAYNDEQVAEIVDKLAAYISKTPIPIIAEFAYQNDIPRHALYDYVEFSTLLKKMVDKKESQLERMCLNKEIEKTMAIFSLKQLGWKDKTEIDANLTVGINIVDDVKQCKNKSE